MQAVCCSLGFSVRFLFFLFLLKPRMLKPLVLIFSKVKIPLVDVS